MTKPMTFIPVAIVLAAPVRAHHSDAGLDMASVVRVEGIVTEYSMRNPHTYLTIETASPSGQSVEWTIQMGSAISLTRRGWTRESLRIGDRISAMVHAATDGRSYGLLNYIETEDGDVLGTARNRDTGEPALSDLEVTASTDSLEGVWMAKSAELVRYPAADPGNDRRQ